MRTMVYAAGRVVRAGQRFTVLCQPIHTHIVICRTIPQLDSELGYTIVFIHVHISCQVNDYFRWR